MMQEEMGGGGGYDSVQERKEHSQTET